MKESIRICDVEKYYGNGSNVVKAVDRVSYTRTFGSVGRDDVQRLSEYGTEK